MDDKGTKWRRNIAENFNRLLSRAHERYRRQTDRQTTDGRTTTSHVHVR